MPQKAKIDREKWVWDISYLLENYQMPKILPIDVLTTIEPEILHYFSLIISLPAPIFCPQISNNQDFNFLTSSALIVETWKNPHFA